MATETKVNQQNGEILALTAIGMFFAIIILATLSIPIEHVKDADTKLFEKQDATISPFIEQVQRLSNDTSQIVITRGAEYISYDRSKNVGSDYSYYVYIEPVAYNAIEASTTEYEKYEHVKDALYDEYNMKLIVDTSYVQTSSFEQYKIIYQQNTNVK